MFVPELCIPIMRYADDIISVGDMNLPVMTYAETLSPNTEFTLYRQTLDKSCRQKPISSSFTSLRRVNQALLRIFVPGLLVLQDCQPNYSRT